MTTVASGQGGDSPSVPTQSIPAAMIEDLKFFTSEELAGRDAVAPTIHVAADYIAEQFAAAGLDVGVFGDSPFQTFDIPVGSTATNPDGNRLEIRLADDSVIAVTLGDGFSPLAIGSTSATVTAPLVWVGYGITAPELRYDDYAGVDATGKIVVMIRKEPGIDDPQSPFDGVGNSRHAFFETKIQNALRVGAVGVLIVNDPISVGREMSQVKQREAGEKRRLAAMRQTLSELPAEATNLQASMTEQIGVIEGLLDGIEDELAEAAAGVMGTQTAGSASMKTGDDDPIPVASIGRDLVDRLLRASKVEMGSSVGMGLSEIEAAIDRDWQPRSFEFSGTSATLSVEMTNAVARSSNVVGVIEGAGPLAGETIVIGAHYDHVGMGGVGSLAPGTIAVHNGADDNASGAATLLQLGRQLVPVLNEIESRRRVVFIAFTAEERGLLGSKYYVDHPRFPISQTAAMINMDMVGRLRDNELTVYGTGSAPVLDQILDEINVDAKFNLFRVASGYGPSDHQSFYEKGIPVLFFFTGLHEDYHRPDDDFEKLNLSGMTRITDTIQQAALRLATMAERPVYSTTSDRVSIRRQLTVFLGVTLSQQTDRVILSAVADESAAAEAGLQTGDKILKMGKTEIQRIDQVMNVLRQKTPGDELSIVIDRDGRTLTQNVQLKAR